MGMTTVASGAGERVRWRAVAIPTEHGGWGLTGEPVLLGLLVAFSWPGVAIGVAAVVAFLARTPLKLALVDRRRERSLPRTRLAWRIAAGELAVVAVASALAVIAAGWAWTLAVAVAVPLFAVEAWFEVRSRGRRLAPELCGAIGITSVAAAIIIAGGTAAGLGAAMSLVLAGRATASIPFVRREVARLHRRPAPGRSPDPPWLLFQPAAVAVAAMAVALDRRAAAGAVAVLAMVVLQAVWSRRTVRPARVLGLRQLVGGLAVVAAAAVGVHA